MLSPRVEEAGEIGGGRFQPEVERGRQIVQRDRLERGEPDPHADAFHALGEAGAVAVAGNPRALAQPFEDAPHASLKARPRAGIKGCRTMQVGEGLRLRLVDAIEIVAKSRQRLGKIAIQEERSIEAELPGDVAEAAELGDAERDQGAARRPFARGENLGGVKPTIGLDVMLHAARELALVGGGGDGAHPAVGHAPEIGEHRADAGHRGSQLPERQLAMEQEVHAASSWAAGPSASIFEKGPTILMGVHLFAIPVRQGKLPRSP